MAADADDTRTPGQGTGAHHEDVHTYLCVVDQTEELHQALRYACNRARSTGGRIALLYAIEPHEFSQWLAVGDLMSQESREEAEEMIQVVARTVQERTGTMPVIYIREGKVLDELLDILQDKEAGVSILVLGANTGTAGPGPLVSQLTLKLAGRVHVPITIVPGNMTDEEIDAIT